MQIAMPLRRDLNKDSGALIRLQRLCHYRQNSQSYLYTFCMNHHQQRFDLDKDHRLFRLLGYVSR